MRFVVHTLRERSVKWNERRDNGIATNFSFLKTLKRVEIHATTYRDFGDLQNRLEEFIERYYNRCRLHSALGYCSPANFEEEAHAGQRTAYAAAMTFIHG